MGKICKPGNPAKAGSMLHLVWQMNSAGPGGHALIVWAWRLKSLALELILFTGITRMYDKAEQ